MADTSSRMLDLPGELIHCILRFVDFKGLLRCCAVCKELRDLIKSSAEHLYTIELALDGLVDTGRSTDTPAEHLRLLRERRKNWKNVNYRQMERIPMTDRCLAYELVGGYFAKSDGRDFFLVQLPSRDNENCVISTRPLDIFIRDFAIDPTQDLLVLLERNNNFGMPSLVREVSLKLRQLSDVHKVHPNATVASLNFKLSSDGVHVGIMRDAFLQIADDIVGLFYTSGPFKGRLLLWQWKDGRLVMDTDDDKCAPMMHFRDFSFLSPRAFMISSISGNGSLHIYSFTYPPSTPPTRVAILQFPDLVEGVTIHRIGTHAAPILAGAPAGKIFTTAPDSRVHVISLIYIGMRGSPDASHQYTLLLHNRMLVKCVESYDGKLAVLNWEEWGPKNTRLFPRPISPHWLRYVHGERLLFATPGHDSERIQLYDFNVGASVPYSDKELYKSALHESALFKETVNTYLPYKSSSFDVDKPHYAYMIDEDRIVGIHANGFPEANATNIDIYAF